MNKLFENLNEIITKEEFHKLFNFLILNYKTISNNELIEYLIILEEKFLYFYDLSILTSNEKEKLFEILVKCTNFNNIKIIEDLVGFLFSFRIDKYATFLKENIPNNIPNNILIEINEAIKEYNQPR